MKGVIRKRKPNHRTLAAFGPPHQGGDIRSVRTYITQDEFKRLHELVLQNGRTLAGQVRQFIKTGLTNKITDRGHNENLSSRPHAGNTKVQFSGL